MFRQRSSGRPPVRNVERCIRNPVVYYLDFVTAGAALLEYMAGYGLGVGRYDMGVPVDPARGAFLKAGGFKADVAFACQGAKAGEVGRPGAEDIRAEEIGVHHVYLFALDVSGEPPERRVCANAVDALQTEA